MEMQIRKFHGALQATLGAPRGATTDSRMKALALDILTKSGTPVPYRVLKDAGIHISYVRDLAEAGLILNPVRGVYVANGDYDPFYLAVASLSAHGTSYLLGLKSAALLHELQEDDSGFLWLSVPNGSNTVQMINGLRPLRIYWQHMQLPRTRKAAPSNVADPDISLSDLERDLGIETHTVYGQEVKVTSAARTMADLLYHMNRPIRRGFEPVVYISAEYAFEALRRFTAKNDLNDVRDIAARLGYLDDVNEHLSLAEKFSSPSSRFAP